MVNLILGISNALREYDFISYLKEKVSYCRLEWAVIALGFPFTLQFDSLPLLFPDAR
jgi:hypothetical protein